MREWAFLIAVAAALGALAGCDRPRPAAGPTPPADGDGPGLTLADGFERGSLADFWLPGNYGTGLYEPEAVVVSGAYARTGTRSARITVKQGDVEQRGDDGRRVERAELDSGHHRLLGRDAWYGFSFLLPPDFPIVDNRLVLASWKQSDVEGSPLIGQRFQAGRHTVTIRPPGASGSGTRYRLPDLRLGRWTDMVYHVRYSPGDDGRVEVWMDGGRVVSYNGPTADKAGADRFYNKVGLYRDRWPAPMTVYVDNYTLGDSFAAVDPSRFDQRP